MNTQTSAPISAPISAPVSAPVSAPISASVSAPTLTQMGRPLLILSFILGALLLSPASLQAQESEGAQSYTLALYTPSLNLRDGITRNTFVAKVAASLSEKTHTKWNGVAFARREDFERSVRNGDIDLAIIDGIDFAGRSKRWTPVASTRAGDKASMNMGLFVSKGSDTSISALRKKSIAAAVPSDRLKPYLTSALLEAQVDAGRFFSKLESVKNTRTALNRLRLGKVDAILSFVAYGSSLERAADLGEAPLPVVVRVSKRLEQMPAGTLRAALRSTSISGAAPLTGFGSFDAAAISGFKSRASRTFSPGEMLMPPLKSFRAKAIPWTIPPQTTGQALSPTPINDLILLPSLPSTQSKRQGD